MTRLRLWWRQRALWQRLLLIAVLTLASPTLVQIPIIVFVPASQMDLRVDLYYFLSYLTMLAGFLAMVWTARPRRERGR